MSRTLSSAAQAAMNAQETAEAFVVLLEITHAAMPTPLRVASVRSEIISNGDTYLGFPFEIPLPEESGDRPPEVELVIDNIDRQIVDAIRVLTSPPTVSLSVILESTPDQIEAGPFNFTLKKATWNQLVVTGTLSYEDILDEPWPSGTFNPSEFPGLFKG